MDYLKCYIRHNRQQAMKKQKYFIILASQTILMVQRPVNSQLTVIIYSLLQGNNKTMILLSLKNKINTLKINNGFFQKKGVILESQKIINRMVINIFKFIFCKLVSYQWLSFFLFFHQKYFHIFFDYLNISKMSIPFENYFKIIFKYQNRNFYCIFLTAKQLPIFFFLCLSICLDIFIFMALLNACQAFNQIIIFLQIEKPFTLQKMYFPQIRNQFQDYYFFEHSKIYSSKQIKCLHLLLAQALKISINAYSQSNPHIIPSSNSLNLQKQPIVVEIPSSDDQIGIEISSPYKRVEVVKDDQKTQIQHQLMETERKPQVQTHKNIPSQRNLTKDLNLKVQQSNKFKSQNPNILQQKIDQDGITVLLSVKIPKFGLNKMQIKSKRDQLMNRQVNDWKKITKKERGELKRLKH